MSKSILESAEPDERDLTQGSIPRHVVRLSIPMAIGIAAVMTMNLVDAYFVGQLGTQQLAAMSFTFPVVFFIGALTFGMSVGVTSVVSRAAGKKDNEKARRATTDSLSLGIAIVAVISVAGYLTIEPIFRMLGAEDPLIPMIREYMSIWYLGSVMLVVPMMGNAAIRGVGDTRTPAMIMVGVAIINIILDPIFIFGWGPIPGGGIGGAASATVAARVVALVAATWVLWKREKLLSFVVPKLQDVLQSWREVMRVGAPAGATRSVAPLTAALITALVAGYGTAAVAGYGAATRVEAFALVLSNGLTSSLVPYVGQNWGAGKKERVYKGIIYTCTVVAVVSLALWGALALFSDSLAGLFTDSEEAIEAFALYVMIVPAGHALQGAFRSVSNTWNAIDRPYAAAGLGLLRTVALIAPLSLLGSEYFGLSGIFWGIMIANSIAGIVGVIAARPVIESTE